MDGLSMNEEIIRIQKSKPIIVHPAAETNGGLYFLSNLDQNFRASIVPMYYCFKADENTKSSANVSEVMKEALAKVLVHYYPLAGSLRINSEGKAIVECTNKGIPFVAAIADCELQALGDMTVTNPVELGKLVHTVAGGDDNNLEVPLLTAQVTRFKCGGFVLGTTINHSMFDGVALKEFLNSWAETARGLPLSVPPFLDRNLLRSRQPPKIEFTPHVFKDLDDVSDMVALYKEDQMLYSSFLFDPDKLSRLKKMAMEDGSIKSCSSFIALTAWVWRARSKSLKMKPHQQTKIMFAVDGRSKLSPPLPRGYFGNGIVMASCICSAGELIEKPFSFTVQLVQDAVEIVNDNYIRSFINYIEVASPNPSFTATISISAWTKLDFNALDFGWGKATQSGCTELPAKEVIMFVPHGRDNKGVNVSLALPGTAMKIFEEIMQAIGAGPLKPAIILSRY